MMRFLSPNWTYVRLRKKYPPILECIARVHYDAAGGPYIKFRAIEQFGLFDDGALAPDGGVIGPFRRRSFTWAHESGPPVRFPSEREIEDDTTNIVPLEQNINGTGK